MKCRIVRPEHAAGLIDPETKRRPFVDDEGRVLEEAEVPNSTHWVRRVIAGELVRVDDAGSATPTGREPITPLTTRRG